MRRFVVATLIAGALAVVPAAAASADVSHTQTLPTSSCNAGTMNAHESIPETTGTGAMVPAHDAVPGTAFVTPCGHGG
jgi:hypothetical protein